MEEKRCASQEELEALLTDFTRRMEEGYSDTITAIGTKFVSCSFAERWALFSQKTAPWMRNPGGVAHGGVVTTIIDNAVGALVHCLAGDKFTPTIDLRVNFLRPMPVDGSTVMVRVQCDSFGSNFAHTTARIWAEDKPDKPIATAAGVYFTAWKK